MSKFSDYIKETKERDLEFFFGKIKRKSNRYFDFERVISNDEFIILTNNIDVIKNNIVMIVDNDKAVYLKKFQIRPVMNDEFGMYTFAVKLNRKYFKTYTFKDGFPFFYFEEEDTFDSLLEDAKTQNVIIAQGWGKKEVEYRHSYR